MNEQKMIKTAKTLDTIVRIGGKIIRAFGIVCLIFSILVLIFGSKMFVPGSLTLDLDFVKLHLSDEFQTVTKYIQMFAFAGLLVGSILCFMVCHICVLVRKILDPMKKGRPFEEGIPAYIRQIAKTVLIGGGIAELLGVAERFLLTKAYPMDEIFSSAVVSKTEYLFTFELDFIWIACIILFLSYIFSYGQVLQKESDETL